MRRVLPSGTLVRNPSQGTDCYEGAFAADAKAPDYLEYDNCYDRGQSGTTLITFNRYNALSQALNETGKADLSLHRPRFLSVKCKAQVAQSSTRGATRTETPP